jgi:hypothetical protein
MSRLIDKYPWLLSNNPNTFNKHLNEFVSKKLKHPSLIADYNKTLNKNKKYLKSIEVIINGKKRIIKNKSVKNRSVKNRSIKNRSIKNRSIKNRSIKNRSVKRSRKRSSNKK